VVVKFILKGRDLEVVCTTGDGAGLPALSYRHGQIAKSFSPQEIAVEATTLGKLVTVKVDSSEDAETTFAVFLPTFESSPADTVDFTTVGMYKELRGPSITPGRPITGWRSVPLFGIAQAALVPVGQEAAC